MSDGPLVKIDDGYACLGVDYHYEIALSRIQTRDDLLRWIEHLGDKKWVTKETLLEFSAKVITAKGWPV